MTRPVLYPCVVALALCVASGPAATQDADDIFPFPVTVFQLDNGLTVVSVTYDSPGIIAYYTIVPDRIP